MTVLGAPRLAERVSAIRLSPTMQGTIAAERLRRLGMDVVDLGAGEPDFPPPPHVVAAAHAAIDAGFTKYTANAGLADLKDAIATRYLHDCGVSYAPEEVVVTAGGKQALFHAAMALFGPGDQVLTHTPGWPTIGEQIRIAGAEPVQVAASERDGFALTADMFLAAATDRTRGVVINSPANPTGALLAEAEAERLAAQAAARGWWIVLDLCYDRLIYHDVPHNLPRIFGATMRDRLVLCGSASKTYALTGWRCGWLAGARAVAAAAGALQSHETSNANAVAQKAVIAALTGPQACVREMRDEYQQRRDLLLTWLSEEPRLPSVVPQGAFYLFPNVTALLTPARCPTSADFASQLLEQEHVVVTPGEAFDAPGFIRISYATSRDRLREGAVRLIRFARGLV